MLALLLLSQAVAACGYPAAHSGLLGYLARVTNNDDGLSARQRDRLRQHLAQLDEEELRTALREMELPGAVDEISDIVRTAEMLTTGRQIPEPVRFQDELNHVKKIEADACRADGSGASWGPLAAGGGVGDQLFSSGVIRDAVVETTHEQRHLLLFMTAFAVVVGASIMLINSGSDTWPMSKVWRACKIAGKLNNGKVLVDVEVVYLSDRDCRIRPATSNLRGFQEFLHTKGRIELMLKDLSIECRRTAIGENHVDVSFARPLGNRRQNLLDTSISRPRLALRWN